MGKRGLRRSRRNCASCTAIAPIPQPTEARHAEGFVKDARQGGYAGEVVVGEDLVRISTEPRA
jgi:hypothetical protein